jgi:hypothetical protein
MLPVLALGARETQEARRDYHELRMQQCLEPSVLARRLGSEDPEVAKSLHNLAASYFSLGERLQTDKQRQSLQVEMWKRADSLYRDALAIREKTLGPEHVDVATTLESYAALLRKLNRGAEAEEMEVRAKAIRASHGQQSEGAGKTEESMPKSPTPGK